MSSLYSGRMFMHYEEDSMGSRDEEEQRPLTTVDIRALLDEQEERINARHKEEIRLQDARHKEEIRLQEERINAAHQEEVRALEEATDRRLNRLERASASSSSPQDATNENNNFTENRRSSNSLAQSIPNVQRRGNITRFSVLLFQKKRNEWVSNDSDDEEGDDDDININEALEEDTFSIMMMSKAVREIPCIHPTIVGIIPVVGILGFTIITIEPYSYGFEIFKSLSFQKPVLYWSLFATSWVMMLGPLSGPWRLSMFTSGILQLGLGLLIIVDQTVLLSLAKGCSSETCGLFHVPIGTNMGMTFAQYLTACFALVTQNDLFTSLLTLSKLRNADSVPWDKVIGKEGNRTWRLWICRILLPNLLKFIQAVVIICTTFLVIIQSTRIVDLLKDFTALLVVSEADNIMFYIANLGYFGEDITKKTDEVKAAQWSIMEEGGDAEEEGKHHRRWRNCSMGSCVFFTLGLVMYGILTYVVVGQYTGRYMKMKYPECNALRPNWIGSGICTDFPPYNTAECGWDGGDCPEP